MSFIFNQIVRFVTPVFRCVLVTWALTLPKAIKKALWKLAVFGTKLQLRYERPMSIIMIVQDQSFIHGHIKAESYHFCFYEEINKTRLHRHLIAFTLNSAWISDFLRTPFKILCIPIAE